MRQAAFRMVAILSVLCVVVHWGSRRFYWSDIDINRVRSLRAGAQSAIDSVQQLLHSMRPESATSTAAPSSQWNLSRLLPASRVVDVGKAVHVTNGGELVLPQTAHGAESARTFGIDVSPAREPAGVADVLTVRPQARVAATSLAASVDNRTRRTTARKVQKLRPRPWLSTARPLPTIDPQGRFVTGYFGIGRLGNNLFVYASTLGVALRHGLRVVYCLRDNELAWYKWMLGAFQLSAPAGACNFDADAYINEPGWGKYTPAVDSPSNFGRRTFLYAYLQSYKYFEAYRLQVLRELALTPTYASYADGVLRQAAAGRRNVTFVGVHVRRGDMVGHRLYNVAPESYLVRAVGEVRQRLGSAGPIVYIVASDDATWTVAMLRRIGLVSDVSQMSASAELDMAVLSRCNHSIITSGSYGWWAAWLAGGDVIYYRGFMPNTSALANGYDSADYYPDSWLGLD